ncbi:protein cortex [Anopheles nili]|uniref:protein cortex n=1 Tax=Anopheles nili TaxID=185578 RepID=UPI00237AA360|nr:protein cortex [Anopheles nili]
MAFSVKKRTNSRLNEIEKIQKPVRFLPNTYGDRFIPRRYAFSRSSRFKAEKKNDRGIDPITSKELPGYWRSHHYENVMQDLFELAPSRDKILTFRESTNQQVCNSLSIRRSLEWDARPTFPNHQKLDWSCRPRTKPVGFIEAMHDLPNLKKYHHKIIDWSAGGQIAAIFSKRLVIWTPTTEVTVGMRAQYTTSIAFDPSGEQLALAIYMLNRPWLNILKVGASSSGRVGSLKMLEPVEYSISCLAWDGSGQFVVCGFDNGQISIVRVQPTCNRNQSDREHKYNNHVSSIFAIKFSCGNKYMASSDEMGNLFIWQWMGGKLVPITHWTSSMCAFFDWHPWREDEIVIAESEPIMIALFHVPSRQVVSYYRRQDRDCIVTTLAFNKISGELVVCYSYSDLEKPPEILVLASMDRVVDVMRNHDDVIIHLLWSPNGRQLASVGCDESLTIWNFFGVSPGIDAKKKKKLQHEPPASTSSTRIDCSRPVEATYLDLTSNFLFKGMR